MCNQLAVIVMVRNEADILPELLAHASTLFDRAIVIDHHSTDGSREILEGARAEWPALEIFDYGFQGYFQDALSTAFARKAFEEGADWVFFLDADEFVDVPDRAALLGALPTDGTAACSFAWRNLSPTVFGSYKAFDLRQEFLARQAASRYSKIALSRRILQAFPAFQVALGNHTVLPTPGAPALEAPNVGEYLHIPIRSRDRLAMKLEAGVAAYRAKTSKQTDTGFHWFELLERMRAGTADDDFLRAVVLEYGDPLSRVAALSSYSARRLRIASAGVTAGSVLPRDGCNLARSQAQMESLDRAVVWRQLQVGNNELVVLIGEDNHVVLRPQIMRPGGEPAPDVFGSLPPEDTLPADDLSEQRLATAIDLAFTPVETLVPSAWSSLIPVMFGLIALLRPRRFVELGSHHGCSFFAASQAMQALNLKAEAIAIDTWQGDPQAGYYAEEVFENFNGLLRTRYQERSHYIRSKFEDSVDCFEDNSIDLLHIDGLHTYNAVRTDFETWLPKMSDRGVVIFHDTTVYERSFGVWQLWQEITVRYPSINLLHGHGLGIVYVGTQGGRFAETLREFAKDPTRYLLLNAFVCSLGDLSIGAATSVQEGQAAVRSTMEAELAAVRSTMEAELAAVRSTMEAELAAVRPTMEAELVAVRSTMEAELAAARSTMEAELATARAELMTTQAQLAAIRASTSWRVSAPVRVLGQILRGDARV